MNGEIAVFDAGPLITFHQAKRLELLRELVASIAIPASVAREIAPSFKVVPGWIEVRQVRTIPTYTHKLGAGEREAIALAVALLADFVVLDDRRARAAAKALGLNAIGSLGLLVRAKRAGLVGVVRPTMDAMIDEGLFVSSNVYRQILELAGEDESREF